MTKKTAIVLSLPVVKEDVENLIRAMDLVYVPPPIKARLLIDPTIAKRETRAVSRSTNGSPC